MKGRAGKNIVLEVAYQVLNISLPLITTPYLTRVLGDEKIGIFSYSASIISIFVMFAMLGTTNYGTRTIAEVGDDKERRSDLFWQIYVLQMISVACVTLCYAVYLLFLEGELFWISLIQLIYLVSCLLDINWLFFGCEEFRISIPCSFVLRILSVGSVFVFVKNESDLWVYTLIQFSFYFLCNLIMLFYAHRLVSFKHVHREELVQHIKPNLVLFVPLLAMSVYHVMDRTMMGILSDYSQGGYYYCTDKVINIPIGILTGIDTVMLPRMTALRKEGETEHANRLLSIVLEGVIAASVAISFGIMAISKEFIPMFFGGDFSACVWLVIVMSPVVIIKGISGVIRNQYLIPLNMEKMVTRSVIGGAVVNLISNSVLIPILGALGAIIGTILAEMVTCALVWLSARDILSFRNIMLNFGVYALLGVIMILVVRTVALIPLNRVLRIVLEVVSGAVTYMGLCIIYWVLTKNVLFNEIINEMNKIKKEKKE